MITYIILLVLACLIFLAIILVAIIKNVTVKKYLQKEEFGYVPDKTAKTVTGISIIDKILEINPGFMNKEIEKTNLCKTNRVDTQTGQQITLQETLNRHPEEKVRLETYYKCLKRFGLKRVEVEFPIQVGSKKCFIDVAVFHSMPGDKTASKEHNVLNLAYVFECKKGHINPNNKTSDGKVETMAGIMASGFNQLKSYMFVCPNLVEKNIAQPNGMLKKQVNGYGCLTNGSTTKFYKKTIKEDGNFDIVETESPNWY